MSENVTIRRLALADVAGVSRCFERCYGTSYVVGDFYDPAALGARIADGSLRSVVAVADSGEIVGHMAVAIRDPRACTVDAGNSIVDPRYRGRQIVERLASAVVELCRDGGFIGFHHYPTTAHPIMQRLAVATGGIETGVMLDYVPATTEYRQLDGVPRVGRLAVVVVYQPLAPTPERRVFVPAGLAAAIDEIYRVGRLPRVTSVGLEPLPSSATRLESHFEPRRSLLRLDVAHAGSDLAERAGSIVRGAAAEVQQVDVRMGEASLGAAVDALRGLGFFFSAVLPEFLDGDVLRLQRIAGASSAEPDLVNDGARRIHRWIAADRSSAESAWVSTGD